MRFVAALAIGLAALGLVAAGEASREKLEKLVPEVILHMNKTADVLETVKDKASAEAAKAKLREVGGKLNAVLKELEGLGKPDPTLKSELEGKYKGKIDSAVKRVIGEAIRISSVEGGKEFLKDLETVFPKMGGKRPSKTEKD